MSAHAAPVERTAGALAAPAVLARIGGGARLTLGLAGVLAAVCFVAGGGLALGSAVPVEIGLTLAGGGLVVAALAAETDTRVHGGGSIALLLALAGLTAGSVLWSIAPDASWVESGRTLAYAFTFAGAVALVRLQAARFASLLHGVLLAGLAVCGYALATRVFPGALSPDEIYARLLPPFGYWNAVGLTAALAVPPCLWLGARRGGHDAVGALAYPGVMLLLVTLMLAYSRGALLALAVGCAFYFAAVPLRLRSLTVLLLGGLGAAAVVAWDFSRPALSAEKVPLAARLHDGHLLGVLLVGVAALLLGAGLTLRFAAARHPPRPATRRRAGIAALVTLALIPLVGAGALAASTRGFGGSISHAWTALTDPHATTPPNDPSRLTAIGSVRARYWNDGLKIGRDHALVGVGAGGYPTARTFYRSDTLEVGHAHGYLIQTFADLGLAGLAVSLLLCIAWGAAAIRAASPFDWAREPNRVLAYTPERVALLTMISCVIIFAVHSLIDWTWFVPGNTVVALLCAGWVAGRGPFGRPITGPPGYWRTGGALRARPLRAAAATAAVVLALSVGWSQWEPLHSQQTTATALAALARHDIAGARTAAELAARRDPLSVAPLVDLATIETAAGRLAAARGALLAAVRLTPSNAEAWKQLAMFDAGPAGNRAQALRDLGPALYLDPQSHDGINQYLDTLRGAGAPTTPPPAPGRPAGAPTGAPAGTT